MSKWLESEIQFLKDNFKNMTCEEMGEKIGRTRYSVLQKYNDLGLKKKEYGVGDKINKLLITDKYYEAYKTKTGSKNRSIVVCKCDCGKEKIIRLQHLVNGHTKSCGCWNNEAASQRMTKMNFKHGKADLKNNRLYRTYHSIKCRCYNKNYAQYKDYGGKGIVVCEKWNNDYLSFEKWALENGYQDNLTIDRKDNNGNYEPDNCKWSTMEEQQNNKNNNRIVTAFGESKTAAAWSRDSRCVVTYVAIIYRLSHGWSPEEAITVSNIDAKLRYLSKRGKK